MISFSAIGRCPLRPPPFNLRLWLGILRGALVGLKYELVDGAGRKMEITNYGAF